MSDSHKSRSRKRHRLRSPSASEPRRRRKSRSKSNQHHSTDIEQDKLSRILLSVEGMQKKFTALSERMTAMESRFCHQEKANLQTVKEQSMDDDRLSTMAGPPLDENECLGNAETSSANGFHETPLVGSLPPLVDSVSPVEDDQSQNTQHNESNVEETGGKFSSTGFFDPEQTTARRWTPTKAFGAFLEKNFRQQMTTDQVNEIVGVYAPPEMDACVAPILNKNILNYIPSNRKKFVKQRD